MHFSFFIFHFLNNIYENTLQPSKLFFSCSILILYFRIRYYNHNFISIAIAIAITKQFNNLILIINKLCKLQTMSTSHNWNTVISNFIISLGFVQLREDTCVYGFFSDGKLVVIMALSIYVDGLISLGSDSIGRQEQPIVCND